MQKARLTRLFWLVVLAALLASCGTMASPPTPTPFPTASPTLTPIPPTNTPLPTNTPAPTATPVPTQSLSSIIETLTVVAQGSGVSEAAAYEKSKSGTHPIVILAPDDEVEDWNSSLPALWQVMNVSQTELVASVGYREVELNRIRYRVSGGGNVYVMRIRIDTVVTLYEAQTGATIDTITFQGVEPIGFPSRLPYGTQYLFGEKVSHETVIDWLKEFVEK